MTYTIEQIQQALADWTNGHQGPAMRTRLILCIIPELIAELEARDETIAGLTDCVTKTGEACAQAMNAKLDLEEAYARAIKERDRAREDLFRINLEKGR